MSWSLMCCQPVLLMITAFISTWKIIVEVANQWLVQLETHALRGSSSLTLVMILCYTTGRSPNHDQRGFTQQLIETDAETHGPTLSGVKEILWKRERKDSRSQSGQGQHNKNYSQLTGPIVAHRDWTANQRAWVGPLHIWNRCVAWSSCRTTNSRSRHCL